MSESRFGRWTLRNYSRVSLPLMILWTGVSLLLAWPPWLIPLGWGLISFSTWTVFMTFRYLPRSK